MRLEPMKPAPPVTRMCFVISIWSLGKVLEGDSAFVLNEPAELAIGTEVTAGISAVRREGDTSIEQLA